MIVQDPESGGCIAKCDSCGRKFSVDHREIYQAERELANAGWALRGTKHACPGCATQYFNGATVMPPPAEPAPAPEMPNMTAQLAELNATISRLEKEVDRVTGILNTELGVPESANISVSPPLGGKVVGTCRGCYTLGTACGKCVKCKWERKHSRPWKGEPLTDV